MQRRMSFWRGVGVLAAVVVLAGRETRTLPVAVYNVLTFEQLWGRVSPTSVRVDSAETLPA